MAKIKSSVTVTDKDLGLKAIVKEIKKAHSKVVHVGIQSGDLYDDGTSIADIAFYNEFGTHLIPSRPFMRQTFEKRKSELYKRLDAEYAAIVSGKKPALLSLNLLGAWYQQQIQNEILDGDFVPNAPSTIARKEAKRRKGAKDPVKPLIDTGRMRQSVRYVIKDKAILSE